MRKAIRSVNASAERYHDAEEDIKKACIAKMKEIQLLIPQEQIKLPEISDIRK